MKLKLTTVIITNAGKILMHLKNTGLTETDDDFNRFERYKSFEYMIYFRAQIEHSETTELQ